MYGHRTHLPPSQALQLVEKMLRLLTIDQLKKDMLLSIAKPHLYQFVGQRSKEAMHTLIGIDEQGHKEVLDYSLFQANLACFYSKIL